MFFLSRQPKCQLRTEFRGGWGNLNKVLDIKHKVKFPLRRKGGGGVYVKFYKFFLFPLTGTFV